MGLGVTVSFVGLLLLYFSLARDGSLQRNRGPQLLIRPLVQEINHPACSRGVEPQQADRFCCTGKACRLCNTSIPTILDSCCRNRQSMHLSVLIRHMCWFPGVFRCGSLSIPCSAVNDDYCDCNNGEDEPGTAACGAQGARFTCTNGDLISTAFVDDGVCDCCDGNDEQQPCSTWC